LGNGNAPPTYDDYCLAGDVFSTFAYSADRVQTHDESGAGTKVVFTITNTGEEDFTISEIGMFAPASINNIRKSVMYERTVLDPPVTIPAGGVGQVTYTVRMNYPTE
jgi:hypothetical protein